MTKRRKIFNLLQTKYGRLNFREHLLIGDAITEATKELQEHHKNVCEDFTFVYRTLGERIKELERQKEKLIDLVVSRTECCDVCPITDTCINSEGTCPYAGILAKGEEEVIREWLMQFISKE